MDAASRKLWQTAQNFQLQQSLSLPSSHLQTNSQKSNADEFWVWIPSTAFARLFCRLWWPVFFVSNKARLLSVYYIVHSLLSRLRKPFRYSQISSKFKQANGYTVLTWYLGSLHVKWRLRAQICHHLKFNCVTRACIFLTVFPLKTHTKKINWFISDYCIGCDAWKNFILLARLLFLRMYLLNFKASTTLMSNEVTRTNFFWLSGI